MHAPDEIVMQRFTCIVAATFKNMSADWSSLSSYVKLETCLGESVAAANVEDPMVAAKNARHAFVAALSSWTQMHEL